MAALFSLGSKKPWGFTHFPPVAVLKNKAVSDVIRRGHRENPEAKRRVRELAGRVDLGVE